MKTKRKPAKPTGMNWARAKYPFDLAECDDCLTGHLSSGCSWPTHGLLTEEINAAIADRHARHALRTTAFLRQHYATLLALREKYDRFWPARRR